MADRDKYVGRRILLLELMSAIMSARTLAQYILLPLATFFVIVVIIIATGKGIELLVTNRWEVVIIAK